MRECATFADIVSDNNFWKGITGQRKDDVDTENPDNVGLYLLQIMKASEREEKYDWFGKQYIAGIWQPDETAQTVDRASPKKSTIAQAVYRQSSQTARQLSIPITRTVPYKVSQAVTAPAKITPTQLTASFTRSQTAQQTEPSLTHTHMRMTQRAISPAKSMGKE